MRNSRGGLGDIPSPGRAGAPQAPARSRRAKAPGEAFGPKCRPFRQRVIAVCRSLTSSSAPIAVRRRRPYPKIPIPKAGYERPICPSLSRWESQGYCTAHRLAGGSMYLAPLPLPVSLAQLALDNLARSVARETVDEVDRLGQFGPGDTLAKRLIPFSQAHQHLGVAGVIL